MWPYSELGIEATTDERAIKRAYASKLKQNRPDENPEGFQRLHEAYQAALQRCQTAATPAPAPRRPLPPLAAVASAPAREPALPPIAVPVPVAFDADAFLHEAITRATANEPAALRRWLEGNEALWSLNLKARVGHQWLAVVYRAAPPMPEECFDEMLAFFRLDHAGAVPDPLTLQQRRKRMHLSWYLAPERRTELVSALGMRAVDQRKRAIRALDRLQRPFRWPSALVSAIWPRNVRSTKDIIQRLAGQPPVDLPPPINPRQQAFWLQAANGGLFNRVGLAIAGAEIAALLLAGFVVGLGFGWIGRMQGALDWNLVGVTVAGSGAIGALLVAFSAWSELLNWQRRFVPVNGVLGWLHFALVPVLALLGLAIIDATDSPMLGWVLAVPALWLALARALHGRQMASSYSGWLRLGIFLIYPISRLVAGAVEVPALIGNVLAGAALLAWTIDAWRRRPVWRRATA